MFSLKTTYFDIEKLFQSLFKGPCSALIFFRVGIVHHYYSKIKVGQIAIFPEENEKFFTIFMFFGLYNLPLV